MLRTPVSLIGYPYVWGGQDEHVEPGFDCSGLVWRTFKLVSYPDAPGLTTVFAGRTAAAMAGEVARSKRIGAKQLEPGDVVFFGKRAALEARSDRPHRDLPRERLDHRVGRAGRLARLDELVHEELRLGPPPARRGRARARCYGGVIVPSLANWSRGAPKSSSERVRMNEIACPELS